MKVKKVNELAIVPTRGSKSAAGYDLYACISEPCILNTGCTVKIGSGIAAEIPEGYVGLVFARSGLATKHGIRPANCVGVIDSDYRGEIIVALHNDSNISQTINPSDRVAQLVVVPYAAPELELVDCLEGTERGSNGFGSSGT